MSRRPDTCTKRTGDVLEDLLEGHARAVQDGPDAARKYLERVLEHNKSLPRGVRFFLYDRLADACARIGDEDRRDEAVALARKHLVDAQNDTPAAFRRHLPGARLFEVGIAAAVDQGRFEEALALCEEAVALGLGPVYERKADSIRRMI